MSHQEDAKRMSGERAADFVEDGMVVGLGTGSTALYAILRLGVRVAQGLSIRCVPTSEKTAQLAREGGIPLISFADVSGLDVAIDGADEVDPRLQLIKGGGGALLREKLVAEAARRFIVVADASKAVEVLGTFPVPVEIVPFAWQRTAGRIGDIGCTWRLREAKSAPYVSDNGNYILDCHFGPIGDAARLHEELKSLTGVVETGLFPHQAELVVVSDGAAVTVKSRAPGAQT